MGIMKLAFSSFTSMYHKLIGEKTIKHVQFSTHNLAPRHLKGQIWAQNEARGQEYKINNINGNHAIRVLQLYKYVLQVCMREK